ncbi:isoprenoid synthase domain-containing protein [Suillus cothurnatus]|nr:isoprenoid synthase domain-containing protein [Suillus cothurnatus]
MNWTFILDDYLDDCSVDVVREMHECCISALRDPINFQTENLAGKICKSFFSRFTETAGPGCTERFIHAFDLMLIAVTKEVDNRAKGLIPDLKSYTVLRRDVSSCKACFALFEYTAQINLPDEVASHPVIMAMEDAANDYASWCNDICSYNKEQSCNDTNTNVIAVVMREQGLDLQGAVDYSGQLSIYIQGMQDLIVTTLHWSFNSVRYFGKDELNVKRDRFIKLLPKRPL